MTPREVLDELQREIEWLEANTEPIAGEHAAARESWSNVRLSLARIDAALPRLPP
jgi:hypothetical protein